MKGRSRTLFSRNILRWGGVAFLTLATATFAAWIAAEFLIVRADLQHADALVVLAGSSTYRERTRYAAQLFRDGRAPRILLTNDNVPSGYSATEDRNPLFVERAIDELKLQSVPAANIEIVPGPVSSTYEEAVRIRQVADQEKLRSILIVTSAYQSRRALWTMRRVFAGSGIEIGMAVVEPGMQAPRSATWWRHRLGWEMVPGEYLKLVYYRLKY